MRVVRHNFKVSLKIMTVSSLTDQKCSETPAQNYKVTLQKKTLRTLSGVLLLFFHIKYS